MTIKFPDWAPSTLIEYYRRFFDEPNSNWYRTLSRETLIALTTHKEMKSVWSMLNARRILGQCDETQEKGICDGVMAFFLFQEILSALVETMQRQTTKSEDVEKYLDIAKSARLLAVKLSQSSLDLSPLYWFPNEGEIEYRALDENSQEFLERLYIKHDHPTLSTILNTMAIDADAAAKHESTRPRLSSRSTTTPKTIFIRALYPYWIKTFGGELARTFAALCRVVLNDTNIGEDDIKNALSSYKEHF